MEIIGQHNPDNLFAGHEVPVLPKGITLAKGQGVLERGTVIGIAKDSGLGKVVNSASTDGSESAFGILTDTVDTGGSTATEDIETTVYVTGLFNSKALVFGGTDTVETHEERLRELGIFLKATEEY
ncbi:head decoration protein [Bacillus sp. 7586-K]|nr:head decoration protein [Bacillus sp. 7586-K]